MKPALFVAVCFCIFSLVADAGDEKVLDETLATLAHGQGSIADIEGVINSLRDSESADEKAEMLRIADSLIVYTWGEVPMIEMLKDQGCGLKCPNSIRLKNFVLVYMDGDISNKFLERLRACEEACHGKLAIAAHQLIAEATLLLGANARLVQALPAQR